MTEARDINQPVNAFDHFAHAWGEPDTPADFKTVAGDFQVEEILGFEPDGAGEHLCLFIEKRNLTTAAAMAHISASSGVPLRDISCAGIKDKTGITRQWLSLRLGLNKNLDPERLQTDKLRIIRCARNRRKIRRGSHRGNRFVIRLRQCERPASCFQEKLQLIAGQGVPNYFGPQRFGHDGSNIAQIQDCFARGRLPKDRFTRGMLLSAARSWIFNAYLSQRVSSGSWNQYQQGDYCILEGSSRGFSPAPDDQQISRRIEQLDIHPAGPLWGRAQAAWMEQFAGLRRQFPELTAGLEKAGLEADWRALRMKVSEPLISDTDDGALMIEFTLGKGAYATCVLRELLKLNKRETDSP
ncbi:MAG: tRNA pseudouridine(13) synthase TruD [Pseudohongiellaceae bacterium]